MVLIRLITLHGLINNVRIYAKYVKSKDNGIADAISRQQFKLFRKRAPSTIDLLPTPIPDELWPISKIWLK